MLTPDPDLNFLPIRDTGVKKALDPESGSATKSCIRCDFLVFPLPVCIISDVQDLREMFEPFGTVMEADVISGKNYGFVHIDASIGKAKISQIVRLVPTS